MLASQLQWGLVIKVNAEASRSSAAFPTSLCLHPQSRAPHLGLQPRAHEGLGSAQGEPLEKWTKWAPASALPLKPHDLMQVKEPLYHSGSSSRKQEEEN